MYNPACVCVCNDDSHRLMINCCDIKVCRSVSCRLVSIVDPTWSVTWSVADLTEWYAFWRISTHNLGIIFFYMYVARWYSRREEVCVHPWTMANDVSRVKGRFDCNEWATALERVIGVSESETVWRKGTTYYHTRPGGMRYRFQQVIQLKTTSKVHLRNCCLSCRL